MTNHAIYAPSKLSRIMACPGSVKECEGVPKLPTTKWAEEGTLLHSYAQQTLEAWPEDPEILYLDPEYSAAVGDAIGYLLSEIDFHEEGLLRFSELKVQMTDFENVYGTLDFASISRTALHITDFKFGRGIQVSPENNPQFLAYLDGFLDFLEKNFPEQYEWARDAPWYVHVVQPRIDNCRKVEVKREELLKFNQEIDKAIRLAEGVNPPIKAGEHCRWCDAGAYCKVRIDYAKAVALQAILAYTDIQNNKVNISELEELLAKKKEVIDAFKAVETAIFLEAAKGGNVKHFKLVRGRSNRTWKDGCSFDQLTEAFPELDERMDEVIETKLRGPAQVEKLLPKARRADLDVYIVKPLGKITLATIDSPKEAVVFNDPTEAFADFIDNNNE